jgi:hypothetical protein
MSAKIEKMNTGSDQTRLTSGICDFSHLPEKLNFSIGSAFGGEGPQLEYAKEMVTCYHRPPVFGNRHKVAERRPTREDWLQFWHGLDKIGIKKWQEHYMNPDVLDGTSWDLEIVFRGQRIVSAGSNSYPGAHGPDYSRRSEFGRFITALEKLSGVEKIE